MQDGAIEEGLLQADVIGQIKSHHMKDGAVIEFMIDLCIERKVMNGAILAANAHGLANWTPSCQHGLYGLLEENLIVRIENAVKQSTRFQQVTKFFRCIAADFCEGLIGEKYVNRAAVFYLIDADAAMHGLAKGIHLTGKMIRRMALAAFFG